jgi:hypothetical protein
MGWDGVMYRLPRLLRPHAGSPEFANANHLSPDELWSVSPVP